MKPKVNPLPWIIFTIIWTVLLGLAVLIITYYKNENYELITRSSIINDRIIKIDPSHGSAYIELTNGRKVLMPSLDNFRYSQHSFNRLAQRNDSLVKNKENDTVYLIKNNIKYIFKLGEVLNLPD